MFTNTHTLESGPSDPQGFVFVYVIISLYLSLKSKIKVSFPCTVQAGLELTTSYAGSSVLGL